MATDHDLRMAIINLSNNLDIAESLRILGSGDLTVNERDRATYYLRVASDSLNRAIDQLAFGQERAEERRDREDRVGPCILTAENIHTEDDCTTHDHEPA